MVAYKKTCSWKNEPSVLYETNNSSSPVATVLIIKATEKDLLQRSENDNLSLNTDLSETIHKNISTDFQKVEFEVQLS